MKSTTKKLFLAFLIVSSASSIDANDSQLWLGLKAQKKYYDFFSLKFNNEVRIAKNISKFDYFHSDLGLLFHPIQVKWLNLGFNGRFLASPEWEFRTHGNLIFKLAYKALLKTSNRTRFEIHVDESGFSKWRGRNKTGFSIKAWEKANWSIHWILSEEFFFVSQGVNENRLLSGLKIWPIKDAGLSLYYQWRVKNSLQENAQWTHAHIIGVRALLKF